MMVIDSDILIDCARKDPKAIALIAATALLEAEPMATRNQRHFRFIDDLDLVEY